MYSTLHCNFLARPLRSLAFASRRPIIQYSGTFQLKARHRNAFTAVTRALSTSCVRLSDRKTDNTKDSVATPPLRENIYTIPNLLTVSRILSCPVLGWSILHDDFFLATGLLVYAGLSDLADGYLARRFSMHSVLGTILDPAADKTLMTTLTVTLAVKGLLPVSLASIIIGRDVLLSLSAFYIRYTSLPAPKTFARYWDFSIPSAEVRPTTISKYNTFAQLALMCATTVTPILPTQYNLFVPEMQILVAVTTVWSGLSYVFSKDAVRIVSETRKQPPPS
ncbi:CDP-alcohol phosphatidyltransferase-domain-containing protein [Suillus subalutaceus]|uniref:CDP-alcohol phosphatidyltransferase-domain-containing protein n=1 Tax=Suillus subalutaceus TaxID=48586 RepID=UPI001B876401|nr:CDP-alcohol phosphatidyltransferase-domain-containing protein [Suillus subalutaceus]KAG1860629.1 CDP-alcohol phosphatidyltransferase-domain-containing protein [Suillus subalutaceus]